MKQELQNFYTYAKKGFLLLELLLSMSTFILVVSIVAMYHNKTIMLQSAAQRRQQAVRLVDSAIETLYYTKQIPSHPLEQDGITVRVGVLTTSPILAAADFSFVQIDAAWNEQGRPQTVICVVCMQLVKGCKKT